MPAARLAVLSEAKAEILEAFDWYLNRSLKAAERSLAELDRAFELILENPAVWPRFEGDAQRYPLRGFPFSLIYRTTPGELEIVAVAHHRRRPGYWRQRGDP